jgi:hypothetical protein
MDKSLYIIILLLIIIVYLIKKNNNMDKRIKDVESREGMANVSGVNAEALASLASMYDKGKLIVKDIVATGTIRATDGIWFGPDKGAQRYLIPDGTRSVKLVNSDLNVYNGDVEIGKKLTVNGGGQFNNARYYFHDGEAKANKIPAPGLRVGTAWGKLGIYAQSGDSIIGAASNNVWAGAPGSNNLNALPRAVFYHDVIQTKSILPGQTNNCYKPNDTQMRPCNDGWTKQRIFKSS